MSTVELWKPICGFSNYQISSEGRIRNITTGRIKKPSILKPDGYLKYNLRGDDGKVYQRKGHRLVLESFVGPCPVGFSADHKNRIRTDNRLSNLRWSSYKAQSENRNGVTPLSVPLDITAFFLPV